MNVWGTLLEEIYLVFSILGEDEKQLRSVRRDLLERVAEFRSLLETEMISEDSCEPESDDGDCEAAAEANSYEVLLGPGESLFDLLGMSPLKFSRAASVTAEEIMSAELLGQLAAIGACFESIASERTLHAFCCAHMKQLMRSDSMRFSCPRQLADAITQEAFVQWIAAAHLYSALRNLDQSRFGCNQEADRLYLQLRDVQDEGRIAENTQLVEAAHAFFAPRILEIARLDAPDEIEHRIELYRRDGSMLSSNTVASELERAYLKLVH